MSKPRSKLLNADEMWALAALNQGWSDERIRRRWVISQKTIDDVRGKATVDDSPSKKLWIIGTVGCLLLKANVPDNPGIFKVVTILDDYGESEKECGYEGIYEALALIGA